MGDAVMDLQEVGYVVAGVTVLTSITLQLEPGEVLGVAGPNGAGKTTLLSVVATLLAPTTGSGTVLGATLGTPGAKAVRPRIGLSGHDPGLYADLTLSENIRLWARLAGVPESAADDTLARVGLAGAADRRAERCSNGMQRRVDLARLLMLEPSLLLLDEAQAGLDNSSEPIIDALIDRCRATGGGAILVSHDASRLATRTDRVETLVDGALGR